MEDAVAPADKVQARKNIIAALNDIDWRRLGKTISVRINGLDTHYMYRDVVDLVEQAGENLDTILRLEDWGLELPLSELYAGIEWEAPAQ